MENARVAQDDEVRLPKGLICGSTAQAEGEGPKILEDTLATDGDPVR